jgi:hypothetical protein
LCWWNTFVPAPLYMTAGVLTALVAVLIYATCTGTRVTRAVSTTRRGQMPAGDCND